MALSCRSCGAPIENGAIDRHRALARCTHCGTLTELEMGDAQPRRAPRSRMERPPVPMPERFQLDRQGGKLVISWPWFSAKFLMLLVFCALWDGFLVLWYAGALAGLGKDGPPPALMAFPLVHVAVGVGLTYGALAGLLNRTTIGATQRTLHIAHGPIPWWGAGPVDGIQQLFSKERVHHGKHGSRSYSYELYAALRSGRQRKLISGLQEASQALWLEQTLEKHLGIEDQPVGGEIPRYG
jgi:hypothetical protein